MTQILDNSLIMEFLDKIKTHKNDEQFLGKFYSLCFGFNLSIIRHLEPYTKLYDIE